LGGIASSATINISVADPGGPTVEAGEDVFLTLPENSLTLEPSVSSDVPVEYNWTQVDGPNAAAMSDPTAQSISVSNLIEGTYIFEFSVTNANGLNTTDRISVTVVAGSTAAASQSGIPRFFSPNDDGTGDYWEWLDVEPFEDSLLSVYNRSGQKIYETVSYNNTWDGKMNGEPLQAGDYYYIIQMGDATDIKGAVRIIR
jgi:gliding motility-associated-like protein